MKVEAYTYSEPEPAPVIRDFFMLSWGLFELWAWAESYWENAITLSFYSEAGEWLPRGPRSPGRVWVR